MPKLHGAEAAGLTAAGDYPFLDRELLVTACGRLYLHRKRINISTVLAGQKLGIRKSMTAFGLQASCTMILDPSTWSRKPCNPSTTPFGTRLSPMS